MAKAQSTLNRILFTFESGVATHRTYFLLAPWYVQDAVAVWDTWAPLRQSNAQQRRPQNYSLGLSVYAIPIIFLRFQYPKNHPTIVLHAC